MSELKIEAGKFYRDKSGMKVFIGAESPFETKYKFVGWYVTGRWAGQCASWTASGGSVWGIENSPNQLVAEWVEQRKWTVYVYSYEPHYPIVSLAAPPPEAKILAKVQVTEGEGL